MPPDYTQQLNRIADALNRPQTPQWVYVILGAALTLTVQLLMKYAEHTRKRWKMRQVIYSEVLLMYSSALQVLSRINPKNQSLSSLYAEQDSWLQGIFVFRAETYYKEDWPTFVSLQERFLIEALYRRYHAALDETTNRYVFLRQAIGMTAQFLVEGSFNTRWLQRRIGRKAPEVLDAMRRIYEEDQGGIENISREK